MEALTTYMITGKKIGFIWEFKYDLNGHLREFKILEGKLSGNQMKWLFQGSNFPASEMLMKSLWINNKEINSLIEFSIGEPDITFDLFMKNYPKGGKRKRAEILWNKLSKVKKIKAIRDLPKYMNICKIDNRPFCLPDTYLSQERWTDEL